MYEGGTRFDVINEVHVDRRSVNESTGDAVLNGFGFGHKLKHRFFPVGNHVGEALQHLEKEVSAGDYPFVVEGHKVFSVQGAAE